MKNHRDTESQSRTQREPISDAVNEISGLIIDAAYQVHANLGPGLLESVYERCLEYELKCRGLNVERQVNVPLVYKELEFDCGFRIDLLVEGCVVVELKATEAIVPVHTAQILTYLKITGHRVGLVLNFNQATLKEGIHRVAL